MRALLLDIEGTTTAIDFVHHVLFPHAIGHLEPWLVEHAAEGRVEDCLEAVRRTANAEGIFVTSMSEMASLLRRWMREDRKHPALKQLQGFVWREGYASGAFKGHLYPEVPRYLRAWKDAGLTLAIYSSGSVEAQELLFRHSEAGDLSALISHHFDTTIGAKREPESYARIASALGLPPAQIAFLSDVEAELDAASASGLGTTQIVRAGTTPGTRHVWAADFSSVVLPSPS